MLRTKLKKWVLAKSTSDSHDEAYLAEIARYLDELDKIEEELNDQIELSNSEVVKATLIHVRDDILFRHLNSD